MKYKGQNKNLISFPLGGIGTGCIGLAGNGRIVDVEIKNRPNKGSDGGFTHFAIKAEDENNVLDARVLNTDLPPDYIGPLERNLYNGYGLGPDRSSMAGFPHFRKGEFDGEFPVAKLDFEDESFPGKVLMTAFNPFIPTNDFDSSLPGAFFEFEVENTADKQLKYTLAFSARNFYSNGQPEHEFKGDNKNCYIFMSNSGDKDTVEYGDITIATDSEEVSCQQYWYIGNWFDSVSVFWNDFMTYGRFKNRTTKPEKNSLVYAGDHISTIASHITLEPKQKKTIRFVMTWSNPYMNNYWQNTIPDLTEKEQQEIRTKKWENYYATQFETSLESCRYSLENFERLFSETELFRKTLYGSTLPSEVIDAVGANLAVLKSPTCLRLTDGSFYAFEGSHPHEGSCEGTCTHVWSYAYAMAYLFPKLERSARSVEYTYSMQQSGGMAFRARLPIGSKPMDFRPAVDGQFGTVLRVYREFMLSGDVDWLKSIWDAVKSTIEYAWSDKNPDRWDFDKDGLMEGRQHHTLDMELFSHNSWLSGMYLAGLKAGANLARILDDAVVEKQYTEIFESGKQKLNDILFNGEYFGQNIDLKDRSILSRFDDDKKPDKDNPSFGYWNEEAGEMKYQIGEGCSIDQVLGQWHSDLLGLGEIFEKQKLESSLKAIYNYNYKPLMYNHTNPGRLFALNDESGTVICDYPKHKKRPVISVPYAEETMHGFEYAAASHMIMHGMEKEGLECVKSVRNRYDGIRRNPFNEIECGSNYARSLASYALLIAYSGFKSDMQNKRIAFNPLKKQDCCFFWANDKGFGNIDYKKDCVSLSVAFGEQQLNSIVLGEGYVVKKILLNDKEVLFKQQDDSINFEKAIEIDTKGALKFFV